MITNVAYLQWNDHFLPQQQKLADWKAPACLEMIINIYKVD
jgi:hypothetical protein